MWLLDIGLPAARRLACPPLFCPFIHPRAQRFVPPRSALLCSCTAPLFPSRHVNRQNRHPRRPAASPSSAPAACSASSAACPWRTPACRQAAMPAALACLSPAPAGGAPHRRTRCCRHLRPRSDSSSSSGSRTCTCRRPCRWLLAAKAACTTGREVKKAQDLQAPHTWRQRASAPHTELGLLIRAQWQSGGAKRPAQTRLLPSCGRLVVAMAMLAVRLAQGTRGFCLLKCKQQPPENKREVQIYP